MKKIIFILSILLGTLSLNAQMLDTIFNGYLSPLVDTAGSAPTWHFKAQFVNEGKTFTGATVTNASKVIVAQGGRCYELDIDSIGYINGLIRGTLTDPSGILTNLNTGGSIRNGAIVTPTSIRGLYPYVSGLPEVLQSCIEIRNKLIMDTISTSALTNVDSSIFSTVWALGDSLTNIRSIIGLTSVLDSTISSTSYSVALSGAEERILTDIAAIGNNTTITLPDPTSNLGKRVSIKQINPTGSFTTTVMVNAIGNRLRLPGQTILTNNLIVPAGTENEYIFTPAYDENSAVHIWSVVEPNTVYSESDGVKFYDPGSAAKQKVQIDYEVSTSYDIPSLTANVNSIIRTSGYFTGFDGGQATYIVDDSGDTPDSVTVFPVNGGVNRRAKLVGEVVDIRQGGFITGTGLTTQQQKDNWSILKALCAKKREVWLPSDTLEVYPTDTIDVTNKYLRIRGTSESQTVISVFPKYKTINRGVVNMFWVDENSVFELEDVTVTQYYNRYAFETYQVTANVDANINKVRIDGVPRVGFFSEFVVGDTLLFQRDSTVVGQLLEVSSIDSVAKTITFTVSTGASANYTTASTFIAKPIPARSTYAEYSAYSKQWNSEHLDRTNFIYSNTTLDEFNNKTHININRCHLKDMDRILNTIQSFNHIYIKDSKLSAIAIAISWTGTSSNQDPDVDINLRMDQTTVYECATVVDGSVKSGEPVATNGVYGSGIYNHSMTPAYISNCSFINNYSTVYRNFSGSKIEIPGRKIVFEDCYFNNPDSDGPNLILPHSMPAYIKNSQFYGVGVYVGFKAHFENCIFDSTVGTNENTTPAPADTVALDISFDNCTFRRGANVFTDGWSNLGNPSNPLQDSRLSVSNSTFFSGSFLQTASEYTNITNCVLKKTVGYTPGVGSSFMTVGSISGYNSPHHVYIDNFNIESGAGTEYFIQYRQPWSTTTLIQNSDLEEATYVSRKATGIELKNVKHRSSDPFYLTDQMNITELPEKQRTGDVTSKASLHWITGASVTLNNILLADFRHNTYVLEDTLLKGVHFYKDYSYTGTRWSKNDYVNTEITILPKNGLYIIPYAIDTSNSSFLGTDTIYIKPNEPVKIWCYGPGSLSQTTGLDTLVNTVLSSDTDSIIVDAGVSGEIRTEPIIPGTVRVYVNGTLRGKDEGDWTIENDFVTSGVKVSGGVDYYRKQHGFYFSESLISGDTVLVTCETNLYPRHKGYQVVVGKTSGAEAPLSRAEINVNYIDPDTVTVVTAGSLYSLTDCTEISAVNFSTTPSGRITYLGADPIDVEITWTATVTSNGTNENLIGTVLDSGATLVRIRWEEEDTAASDRHSVSAHGTFSMSNGDWVEPKFTAESNGTIIEVISTTFSVKELK